MVWYSHLFKNFPQFAVIYTVKGFSVVSEAVDIFLEFSYFFYDPTEQLNSNSLLGGPLLILRSLSGPLILPQVVPLLQGSSSVPGKGHEEGGSAYAKVGSSLRSLPGNSRASTPQNQSLPTFCFVLSPTPLTLRGLSPTTSL